MPLVKTSLVSIVVPIYDVEDYIEACVGSILGQTYKNLQVILVDDESPDNCPTICDSYAQNDARVQVIHQKNQGVSAGRNAGLNAARGEYVCFIDGDDNIDKNFVSDLLKAIDRSGADIAVCGLSRVSQVVNSHIETRSAKTASRQEAVKNLLSSHDIVEISACNKLYSRRLFIDNGITFPVGRKYSEDALTAYRLYCASERIVYIADTHYHYVQRAASATGTVDINKSFDCIEIADEVIDLTNKAFPELKKTAIAFRLRFTLYVATEICSASDTDKKALNALSKWVRNHLTGILTSPSLPMFSRARALVLSLGWLPYTALSRMLPSQKFKSFFGGQKNDAK